MFVKGLSWHQLQNLTPVKGHNQYSTNNAKMRTTVVHGVVKQYMPPNTVVSIACLVINAYKRGDYSSYINGLQLLDRKSYRKVQRALKVL